MSGDGTTRGDASGDDTGDESVTEPGAVLGEYSWEEFLREQGRDADADAVRQVTGASSSGLIGGMFRKNADDASGSVQSVERAGVDVEPSLGVPAARFDETVTGHASVAAALDAHYHDWLANTPVTVGSYTWEHFKHEYYYEDGDVPRDDSGDRIPFEPEEYLERDPSALPGAMTAGASAAEALEDVVDRRTVNVNPDIDEDEFFSSPEGHTTVANRYDLEKSVALSAKESYYEIERYWVNKPYAFVIVFHSIRENEKKYHLVEPYLTDVETDLVSFLSTKLRAGIKYGDAAFGSDGGLAERRTVIEQKTRSLLDQYGVYGGPEQSGETRVAHLWSALRDIFDDSEETRDDTLPLDGIEARPEPVVAAEGSTVLSEYQVEKLLYRLRRDFVGYGRIDGIKHDINVEDISCDGYDSPVFVYHSEYEQILTNVYHGRQDLDDFVVKLAQRSGKGISKRRPQVDATLPDGSRAQLTLGREVSDHGTNYTIRQFNDVPFTPVDLINWNTFNLDQMAFLWLCIENERSLMLAGGTASGKTTALNAVSLFIPSNSKIVSIEDTREVELPQRNWVASVTRPSFSEDGTGDVDEFDLLESALRQRPEYIVMGEVRGEEGRTLFQVMSTGHTTNTTFHADSVGEVIKRFTTDPINVSKTLFTALDLVAIQTQTRVRGKKVRRNKTLTEINHYDTENDEVNVTDVYQWQAETDEFLKMGNSNTLEQIQFNRGWTRADAEHELFTRRVVLAYLINNGLTTYAEVAGAIQAFINDADAVLSLMANGRLEEALDDLRSMGSVVIDVDEAKEALVPRPQPDSRTYERCQEVLERAEEEGLFDDYRGRSVGSLFTVFSDLTEDTVDGPPSQPDSNAIFDILLDRDGAARAGGEAPVGLTDGGETDDGDEPTANTDTTRTTE